MEIKFDFNDILIEPAAVSYVDSRTKINILDENGMLPIFTAPMFDVVSEENSDIYNENRIYSIIPRKSSYNVDELITNNPKKFIALGLDDFINLVINTKLDINYENKAYILIDIANGNMIKLVKSVKKSKDIYGDNLILMVGNIANPETYAILSDAGADMIRVGIGGGSACHIGTTNIKTKKGISKISDIRVGDYVLTHKGTYEKVLLKHAMESNDLIKINNNISTSNHEYYVLNKNHKNYINDDNLHEYAEWLELSKITKDYFLLEME